MRVTVIQAAFAAAVIFFCSISDVRAGGLIECNNCASPRDAALLTGAGLTVVMDFDGAKLTAFNVEYDRELRKWRALPTPVPPQIQLSFLRVVDATTSLQLRSSKVEAASGGGPVLFLHPDNPGNTNSITFPDSYRSSNTFDVVQSSTLRTRLGQYLAAEISGANTDSPNWNALAESIQQQVLTWSGLKGGGTITIIITWGDGSKTIYKITATNATEAAYVKGESRDSTGNKVPDESISDPATAPSYAGSYYFGQTNDMNRWIRSAQQYGVPVTGSTSAGNRMSCAWDGRTVTCKLD